MHKTKKKTKPVKLPKPIKIKKEKTEEDRSLQSMAHYIDDRLELVKQIFGTLKPKTITNLAPEFVKKKPMDEIEELCLNELLGISTKRLLSIINGSKCPSDTESSGDSDVEHKEEHISLEEISSDSELEGASSSAAKKKASNSKKGVKSATENNQNDGQISVLELLELQARARAIRSQLAHEPVTKIEVDSDEGDAAKAAAVASKSSKESRRERKRKSSDQDQQRAGRSQMSSVASTSKPSKSNGSTEAPNKESDNPTSKKIKLKRTYRNGSKNSESSAIAEDTKSLATEPTVERHSRSPSPDVIPIVTDCVTLLISDDSEDEEQAVKSLEKAIVLAANNAQEKSKSDRVEEQRKARKITETEEEGEIVEKEYEKPQEEVTEKVNECTELTKEKDEPKSGNEAMDKEKSTTEDIVANPEDSGKPTKSMSEDSNSESSASENKLTSEVNEAVKDTASVEQTSAVVAEHSGEITENDATTNPIEDDDQNDDVISIGGGDLESEMSDHLTQDTKQSSPKADAKEDPQRDADVISLESSEDERPKAKLESSESWHARYLKSAKVSKVLATSRLGKRVRDKIKKSKRSKKESMREAEAEAAATKQSQSSSSSFTSKHEDGSVEQYKELLEMRPRKT